MICFERKVEADREHDRRGDLGTQFPVAQRGPDYACVSTQHC